MTLHLHHNLKQTPGQERKTLVILQGASHVGADCHGTAHTDPHLMFRFVCKAHRQPHICPSQGQHRADIVRHVTHRTQLPLGSGTKKKANGTKEAWQGLSTHSGSFFGSSSSSHHCDDFVVSLSPAFTRDHGHGRCCSFSRCFHLPRMAILNKCVFLPLVRFQLLGPKTHFSSGF